MRALDWEEAHVSLDKAIEGIPTHRRGSHADGFEHTVWQLLEHIRVTQKDLVLVFNPSRQRSPLV